MAPHVDHLDARPFELQTIEDRLEFRGGQQDESGGAGGRLSARGVPRATGFGVHGAHQPRHPTGAAVDIRHRKANATREGLEAQAQLEHVARGLAPGPLGRQPAALNKLRRLPVAEGIAPLAPHRVGRGGAVCLQEHNVMIDRIAFARQSDLHMVAAVEARVARVADMEVGILHPEERP